MTFLMALFRWLTRPPYVHIPFETPLGHHRCRCGHRADDHLGGTGYCTSCTCSFFELSPWSERTAA